MRWGATTNLCDPRRLPTWHTCLPLIFVLRLHLPPHAQFRPRAPHPFKLRVQDSVSPFPFSGFVLLILLYGSLVPSIIIPLNNFWG